jgi:hypothetical protein
MAANRTFQFYGIGYGSNPVTVTARVNSTEIFSGEITTVDQPIDPYPDPIPSEVNTNLMFSLADSALLNTNFAGSLPMTIAVTGGEGAMLGWIDCNYYLGNTRTDPAAGTVGNFGRSYVGNPPNSEGTSDDRSSVVIGGVPQIPNRPPNGRWIWLVPTGSTVSYNWNISVGQVGNVPGNSSSYTTPI